MTLAQAGINWRVYKDHPEVDCYCRCGVVYQSRIHVNRAPSGKYRIVTQRRCPNRLCRSNYNVKRCQGDAPDFDINNA